MNKSKVIGTKAETIVVKVAQRNGFPYARRSVLSGNKDKGDVHLGDGTDTILEVKGGAQCKSLTPAKMAGWMAETREEILNANAKFGFLVTQVAGKGEKSAEDWLAHIPSEFTQYRTDPDVNYVTVSLKTALDVVRGVIDNG